MNKYLKATAGALLLAGFIAPNVNAADIPYGMSYSGGEVLGASNVVEAPTLINSLTELTKWDESEATYHSNSDLWHEGYWLDDQKNCFPSKYLLFSESSEIDWENEDLGVDINDGTYTRSFRIKDIQVYDPNNKLDDDKTFAIRSTGGFNIGEVFTDKKCKNRINTYELDINDGKSVRLYAETETKLYKNSTGKDVFDDLYYGITDIDAAQSYKILNEGNEFVAGEMYARSIRSLQPSEDESPSNDENMYVDSGNYIYSEGMFNTHRDASIFVKVKPQAQSDGLRVVYGFRHKAGSSTLLFAKQLLVQYESDDKGVITGIEDEEIISGDNPTGSSTEPNEGYELDYWTADKDVTLEDGTVIEAGKPLTPEEVMLVDVREDLVFTAIHKAKEEPGVPEVPDTGNFTGSTNGVAFSIAAMMAIGVTLSAWIIARINHKKVQFNKH